MRCLQGRTSCLLRRAPEAKAANWASRRAWLFAASVQVCGDAVIIIASKAQGGLSKAAMKIAKNNSRKGCGTRCDAISGCRRDRCGIDSRGVLSKCIRSLR